MNIIFLDFDGVLNSQTFFIKRDRNMRDLRMIDTNSLNESDPHVEYMLWQIDLDNLDLLRKIVDETDSKIVVISSWKQLSWFDKIAKHLIDMKIPIIDTTKDNGSNRGEGIKNYLNTHDISNYIIIDDEIFPDYDEELINHLVKTSFYRTGLNEESVKKAIDMLKGRQLLLKYKQQNQ